MADRTDKTTPVNYDEPVAYAKDGQPLYAHPAAAASEGRTVHVSRSLTPPREPIPPEIQETCEASRKKYPHLNLSHGEFVITEVKRHPIGLIQIWAIIGLLILGLTAAFAFLLAGANAANGVGLSESFSSNSGLVGLLAVFMLMFFGAVIAGGFVASWVYQNNRFYLTNESVIQDIQTSLFSKHEQTVSLMNIEDASYRQDGILAYLFNYGTIRLSTEGEETTYGFNFAPNPKRNIAILNNAVEAFKNGRPVDVDENEED